MYQHSGTCSRRIKYADSAQLSIPTAACRKSHVDSSAGHCGSYSIGHSRWFGRVLIVPISRACRPFAVKGEHESLGIFLLATCFPSHCCTGGRRQLCQPQGGGPLLLPPRSTRGDIGFGGESHPGGYRPPEPHCSGSWMWLQRSRRPGIRSHIDGPTHARHRWVSTAIFSVHEENDKACGEFGQHGHLETYWNE